MYDSCIPAKWDFLYYKRQKILQRLINPLSTLYLINPLSKYNQFCNRFEYIYSVNILRDRAHRSNVLVHCYADFAFAGREKLVEVVDCCACWVLVANFWATHYSFTSKRQTTVDYHSSISSLNLPLSFSSTTSLELLSQFSTCSRSKWLESGWQIKKHVGIIRSKAL